MDNAALADRLDGILADALKDLDPEERAVAKQLLFLGMVFLTDPATMAAALRRALEKLD